MILRTSCTHFLALLSMVALSTTLACTGGGGEGGGGGGGGGGGAGSGVTSTKQLKDLSADEQMDVCTWGISTMGGENLETDCGSGTTTSTGTVAECLEDMATSYDSCDISVAQLESCVRALADDPCGAISTPACSPVLACAGG